MRILLNVLSWFLEIQRRREMGGGRERKMERNESKEGGRKGGEGRETDTFLTSPLPHLSTHH